MAADGKTPPTHPQGGGAGTLCVYVISLFAYTIKMTCRPCLDTYIHTYKQTINQYKQIVIIHKSIETYSYTYTWLQMVRPPQPTHRGGGGNIMCTCSIFVCRHKNNDMSTLLGHAHTYIPTDRQTDTQAYIHKSIQTYSYTYTWLHMCDVSPLWGGGWGGTRGGWITHCASVPAAVQERAASWTRIHTKQPRLLGDISKEARKALDNDPLVRCHARSRSHGPSNFLKKFRFIWLLHTPLQSKLFKTKFVSEMTTNLTSSGQYHLWKQCPTPRVAMSPWHLSTSMWVKVFLKEKFQPTPIWAWQSSKRNPYHNGPFWGIASNIPCPTWDEVVMLTLCSESLHRVHMASSVSLSIMENPAVLQTTPVGNTSDSLLAVLLLVQAKSMELESQRYGTSEKGWRDPWATTRTFGYQIWNFLFKWWLCG